MKKTILFLLIIICEYSYSQIIPEFESNTKEKDKKESFVYTQFHDSYDITISYTKYCYWPTEQSYLILGQKDGKWELNKWTVRFKSRDKDLSNIKKLKRKKLHIDNISVDSLLSDWTKFQFWIFRQDSLNCNFKVEKDSTITSFSISDGCSDSFEVITKDNYRITSSYLADKYQELIPIPQRQLFILCRDRFFSIIQNSNSMQ